MKKTRLIYCCGYHSLVNVASILTMLNDSDKYNNILLFVSLRLEEGLTKKYINIINDNIVKFAEVYYINYTPLDKKAFLKNIDNNLQEIVKKYNFIEEMWEDGSNFILNKINLLVPYERKIIYDEGSSTYATLFQNDQVDDIHQVYLLNLDLFSYEDIIKYKITEIDNNIYKDILVKIGQLLQLDKIKDCENSILFIGSLFTDAYANEVSLEVETKLIKTLITQYNYIVYYKKHPRETEDKLNKIKTIINHDNFKVIDFPYDIEVLLVNNKFNFILSYCSSCQFNSFKVFNIPSFIYSSSYLLRAINSIKTYFITQMAYYYIPNINSYFNNKITLDDCYKESQKHLQKKLEIGSIFQYIALKTDNFILKQQLNNKKNKGMKIFINILAGFIPFKKLRQKVRKKIIVKVKKHQNHKKF